jgi:hypothetical protein
MGVRHPRIFAIEGQRTVTPAAAQKYLAAVAAAVSARDGGPVPMDPAADALAALAATVAGYESDR